MDKLDINNYTIPSWMTLIQQQNPTVVKALTLEIIHIDNIEVNNAKNVARFGDVDQPTVKEIARSFNDFSYKLNAEPVAVTRLLQTSSKSKQKPFDLEFGFHRANGLLEPSQSRIDSLPTVIIDWYDGLSDDDINQTLSQFTLCENNIKDPRNEQSEKDNLSGYWNMVKDFRTDDLSPLSATEQKLVELHERLRALVRINRPLFRKHKPFVPPFHRYENVKDIVKELKVAKGVITPPWNLTNQKNAQTWINDEYDQNFEVVGFGVADQFNFSQRRKPYAFSSKSDKKAYVLYYPSNAHDRIFGDLVSIGNQQDEDGLNIPIHVYTQATNAEEIKNIHQCTVAHVKKTDQELKQLNPDLQKKIYMMGIIPSDRECHTQKYDQIINYQHFKQDNTNATLF